MKENSHPLQTYYLSMLAKSYVTQPKLASHGVPRMTSTLLPMLRLVSMLNVGLRLWTKCCTKAAPSDVGFSCILRVDQSCVTSVRRKVA
jgi:hypothetical protein